MLEYYIVLWISNFNMNILTSQEVSFTDDVTVYILYWVSLNKRQEIIVVAYRFVTIHELSLEGSKTIPWYFTMLT